MMEYTLANTMAKCSARILHEIVGVDETKDSFSILNEREISFPQILSIFRLYTYLSDAQQTRAMRKTKLSITNFRIFQFGKKNMGQTNIPIWCYELNVHTNRFGYQSKNNRASGRKRERERQIE